MFIKKLAMLKYLSTLLLFLSALNINSQTLTQAFNEPIVGDTNKFYLLDTSLFIAGMPTSITGSTSVWNFSKLSSINPTVTENYVSPTTVTAAASYTGCSVVKDNGVLYTFMKSTTTPSPQTEVLGVNSNTLNLKFTNSAIIAKYPISYGSTNTDNVGGSFTFSVSGTFTGNINTTADGLGTLIFPNSNTLTNVLRVKSVQSVSLSVTIFPLPPAQAGTIKQTVYHYYLPTKKFPVLSIDYMVISVPLISSTPTVITVVRGNRDYFTAPPTVTTAINEAELFENEFLIYPNPSHDYFYFKNLTQENGVVEIFNIAGQKAKSLTFNEILANNNKISTHDLSKGVYFVNINTGTKIAVRKLFVE